MKRKARKLLLKEYKAKLNAHYGKTISIYADDPEQAAEKLKTVLFDTDAVQFLEEDFVHRKADITDAHKQSTKEMESKDRFLKGGCCSDCLCQCAICRGYCGEDGY